MSSPGSAPVPIAPIALELNKYPNQLFFNCVIDNRFEIDNQFEIEMLMFLN